MCEYYVCRCLFINDGAPNVNETVLYLATAWFSPCGGCWRSKDQGNHWFQWSCGHSGLSERIHRDLIGSCFTPPSSVFPQKTLFTYANMYSSLVFFYQFTWQSFLNAGGKWTFYDISASSVPCFYCYWVNCLQKVALRVVQVVRKV